MKNLVCIIVLIAVAAPVLGLPQRTFVSAERGNDTYSCGPADPCRTFAKAIAAVATKGEVIVLDSGGYGPNLVIGKSVSIVATGVYAGVTSTTGSAISISGTTEFDRVAIRGLTLNGLGGYSGINVVSPVALFLDDVQIDGFQSAGVFGYAGHMVVRNSVFTRNDVGVRQAGTTGHGAFALLDRCLFTDNYSYGLLAGEYAKMTVRDSSASGNLRSFAAWPQAEANAELNLENCVVANSGTAIVADEYTSSGSGYVRVSNSTIVNNQFGLWANTDGVIASFGNNRLAGNTVDGAFNGPLPLQ